MSLAPDNPAAQIRAVVTARDAEGQPERGGGVVSGCRGHERWTAQQLGRSSMVPITWGVDCEIAFAYISCICHNARKQKNGGSP